MIAALIQNTSCAKVEESGILLSESEFEEMPKTEEDAEHIFVYVCGAVQSEGVYELPSGSRVFEAIEKAGGFRKDAVASMINLAEILEDAERIYVPTLSETEVTKEKENGKINLNTASKEELMSLPGVGESKAESILSYRNSQGRFRTIEELMQISGIKEGLFEKIKDYITV